MTNFITKVNHSIIFFISLLSLQNFPHFYSMFLTNLYKILSFILLPIGCYIALGSLSGLLFAISNPPILLFLFIVSCSAIYIFSAFIFTYKGIIKAIPCKASLKDWIKINGYISVLFSSVLVFIFIKLLNHQELFGQIINQINTMQKTMQGASLKITESQLLSSAYLAIAFGIILLFHIALSFNFIKTKSNLFEEE